jgi:hypothetical protein
MIGFESKEEMLDWMARQRAEVQARTLHPAQVAITYGSHAVRFIEDLVIFNWVPTLAEQDEDDEVLEAIDRRHRDDNMLWVRGYSTVEPRGELGYSHRSVMWPITARTFASARLVDWDWERMDSVAQFDLANAFREFVGFLREGGEE